MIDDLVLQWYVASTFFCSVISLTASASHDVFWSAICRLLPFCVVRGRQQSSIVWSVVAFSMAECMVCSGLFMGVISSIAEVITPS